ncbi:MAG TPA: winged helix-turn-helix domain-containing protein [Pyrinomonadaceae bacterium]|nr:winged helix-turn-helix domain-containing protein [Pyrinomonadaceae bacterium]
MKRSTQHNNDLYHFGPFCLDGQERVLLREGRVVPLPAKALRTLLMLVLSGGHLVEKDALMKEVWPEEFVEEANLAQHIFILRRALGETAENPKYIETIPRRGYRFIAAVREDSAAAPPEDSAPITRQDLNDRLVDIQSIAVLPFETLGAETQDKYLGLGLADALITKLSRLKRLIVRPTSAVRNVSKHDAVATGRALKVDSVLEGTIQKSGEHIRVRVQLAGARDRATLWAEQFDEEFTNIFSIEDSISEQVVKALAVKLTAEEQERLVRRYTENTEAHQAYLKGRYFFDKRTQESIAKSIKYFELSIRTDPAYAIAYAGLAECYCALGTFDLIPPKNSMTRAREAALKALSIEPYLAEAHAALGWSLLIDWEWTAVEKELQLAIELNNNLAIVHQYYALYLRHMRRFDESLAESNKAQELNPTSASLKATEGGTLCCAGHYNKAEEELCRAFELDANNPIAHYWLARIYVQKGMYDAAIKQYERTGDIFGKSLEILAHLGYVHAISGNREDARRILNELEESSKRIYVPPLFRALIYAGLDQKEEAFDWLERSYQEHDINLISVAIDPALEGLHEDPRFTNLLQRTGHMPHL